jgi:phage gp46-like protein
MRYGEIAMNRFQGDPAITLTPDGARMKFRSGQPEMDQGLENAALISLFTEPGWWGNDLSSRDEEKIGSDYDRIRTIIDIQTLNDYRDAAELALAWMRDTGIASKIDVTVTNPSANQIKTAVIVSPPGRDSEKLLFLKNGMNWINQATNPAHTRMT